MLDRVGVEDDIVDNVLALVAPVSNDALFAELHFASLNPLMLSLLRILIFQFNYSIKTAIRRHELKNRVDHQCAPKLTLESRGLKA